MIVPFANRKILSLDLELSEKLIISFSNTLIVVKRLFQTKSL